MTIDLKALSILGAIGTGAGVSAPLAVIHFKNGVNKDIFLVGGDNEKNMELIRSLFTSKGTLESLFKKWKKKFGKQVDKKAVKFADSIVEEFNKHSSGWKKEKDKISKSVSDVVQKLWNTLSLQDSMFGKHSKKVMGYFKELEKSIKDIKNIQDGIVNWKSTHNLRSSLNEVL